MAALLEIEDLHIFYGAIEALKGVSLTLDQGEIVTVLGANGAGKSTLLTAISGLLPIPQGTVRFCRMGWYMVYRYIPFTSHNS